MTSLHILDVFWNLGGMTTTYNSIEASRLQALIILAMDLEATSYIPLGRVGLYLLTTTRVLLRQSPYLGSEEPRIVEGMLLDEETDPGIGQKIFIISVERSEVVYQVPKADCRIKTSNCIVEAKGPS
jgi:hypothetical protein